MDRLPGAEQIKAFISPAVLVQQSMLVATVAEMFDRVQRDAYAPLEYERYRKTLQGVVEALVSEPLSASYILELGGSASSDLRHGAEVCVLSMLLGLKLDAYLIDQRRRLLPREARDVVSLGLGAMMHDTGKTQIDAEVRDRYESTRDPSDPRYREHVLIGHKMLSGAIAPAAAGVVLHHHQHFDGSGFPSGESIDGEQRGMAGEDIHVFARIVCIANHFDRLRRAADGSIVPRVRVLRDMLATSLAARFDPVVLATVLSVVPAYPPGSIIKLSDGTRGVVTAWHPDAPCQPTILTVEGGEDSLLDLHAHGREIDLRTMPHLKVIEHDGVDVSGDNFRLLTAAQNASKNAA